MFVSRRTSTVGLVFFFVILLLTLLDSGGISAQSLENETIQRDFGWPEQVSASTIDVTVQIFLGGRYDLFDSDIHHEVEVLIAVNLSEQLTSTYVVSAVPSFSLTEVIDLPDGAYFTYGFWGYPPRGILRVYIPANQSNSFFRLKGYLSGPSVLWRNIPEIHFLNVTSSLQTYTPYRLILVPPSGSKVLKIYSHRYQNLVYQMGLYNGHKSFMISQEHPESPVVILYEPENWEVNALVVMLITLFAVFMLPHLFSKVERSSVRLQFLTGTHKLLSSIATLKTTLKRLYSRISNIDSRKLLEIYVLCAILMVSVSFTFGPDPRLKIYVLASTPENADAIAGFASRQGVYSITVFDEMNEFKTLVDLGVVSAVIVGDFFPPDDIVVRRYIYPALDSVSRIIVIEEFAYSTFSTELQRRYADTTEIVERLGNLGSVFYRLPRRTNVLGLDVDPAIYVAASIFVGLCSFVLVFFGIAFLAFRVIEVGKKPGVGGFPEAVLYSVVVFVFSQIIYTVCSVLLATPLGLHASTPKVTAIGFLGFGGGSRLRMLAGFFGFLFGSFVSMKGGLRLDKVGLASFLAVTFFVIVDPFTGGIIFYEFILLFTIGPTVEYGYAAWSYVRAFLYSIGFAFGAWVSPTYAISSGIILYYAGAISCWLFTKLKKSTAMVLLLSSSFWIAQGSIRVADMNPWRAVASVVPGIIAALFFTAIFCFLNFIETVIRDKTGISKLA